MRIIAAAILMVALLPSCATTHSGDEISRKGFAVSCAEQPSSSTRYISAISCTFENTSAAWTTFKIESVEFADKSQPLSPEDSLAYLHALGQKQTMDNYNTNLALGSLVIAGAAIGGSSRNHAGAAVGLAAMGAGVAGMAAKEISDERDKAQFAGVSYGDSNLMNKDSFRVPQELFTRKATLINLATASSIPVTLRVCLSSPAAECIDVPLRAKVVR